MRSGLFLIAALVLAGCAASPSPATPTPGPSPMLGCAAPCARAILDGPVHEPWVAIDPKDPDHLVAGGFGTPSKGGAMPVAVTFDGGATWAPATLPLPAAPTEPAAAYASRGDIMIAFANDGTVLVTGLVGRGASTPFVPNAPAAGGSTIEIALWRSSDGGRTFPVGRIIHSDQGATTFVQGAPVGGATVNGWDDKEFLVVDRATGEAHIFWDLIGTGPKGSEQLAIYAMHSTDAGATWSDPVPILPGQYGASAAAYDGMVLLTARNPGYHLYRSTDAGRTWGAPMDLGDRPADGGWQAAPVALWPAEGGLHALVAKASGPKSENVTIRRSLDGGATWSEPVRVFDLNETIRRNPAMDVDATTGRGVLAVYEGQPPASVLALPLVDGVAQEATRLGSQTAGSYVYEYFGAAASARGAHVVWADEQGGKSPLMDTPLLWEG